MRHEIYRLLQQIQANKQGNVGDTTKGAVHFSGCSGYDGIGLGLEMAGTDIGFTIYVEIEAYASTNLAEKIERGSLAPGVLFSDIKTFPFGKFRGLIDILSGGFPCQPFSSEGHRKADEDPRHLFPYFLKGIKDSMPTFILLENVDGICSATLSRDTDKFKKGMSVLQYVLAELELLGYTATAVPNTAAEEGANHPRGRWFIVAVLNSKGQRQRRDEIDRKEPTQQSTNPTFIGNTDRGSITRGLRKFVFPNKKKTVQKHQEPSRVIKSDEIYIVQPKDRNRRVPDKHKMGRAKYGTSYRMDYAGLCESATSPEDEMRLLGNGVCPQQVAAAFKIGLKECMKR